MYDKTKEAARLSSILFLAGHFYFLLLRRDQTKNDTKNAFQRRCEDRRDTREKMKKKPYYNLYNSPKRAFFLISGAWCPTQNPCASCASSAQQVYVHSSRRATNEKLNIFLFLFRFYLSNLKYAKNDIYFCAHQIYDMRDDAMGIRKKLINHMKESSSADKEQTAKKKKKCINIFLSVRSVGGYASTSRSIKVNYRQ